MPVVFQPCCRSGQALLNVSYSGITFLVR